MKRTALKRKPWRRALGTAERRFRFHQDVLSLDEGCVMRSVGHCDGSLQAAHIVPKQRLRREGFGPEIVYAASAAMCLCERHHNRHDRGLEKVPYALVPDRCKRFVSDYGFHRLLKEIA